MPVVLILIFGLLASAFALLGEILLLPGLFTPEGVSLLGLIGAAMVEEGSKLLFLLTARRRGVLPQRSGIFLLGLCFGIGFVATETILSALRGTLWHAGSLASGALHIATSLLLLWGIASSGEVRRGRMAATLAAAILIHAAYNLILFAA